MHGHIASQIHRAPTQGIWVRHFHKPGLNHVDELGTGRVDREGWTERHESELRCSKAGCVGQKGREGGGRDSTESEWHEGVARRQQRVKTKGNEGVGTGRQWRMKSASLWNHVAPPHKHPPPTHPHHTHQQSFTIPPSPQPFTTCCVASWVAP